MRPDHIVPNELAGGAGSSSEGASPQKRGGPQSVPPADGFRNGRPCSAFFGEKVDTTDPAYKKLPEPAALRAVRLHAAAAAGGLRHPDAARPGSRRVAARRSPSSTRSPRRRSSPTPHLRRSQRPGHPLTHAQFSQVVFPVNPDLEGPDQCDAAGWYGEETLDVEAVHAHGARRAHRLRRRLRLPGRVARQGPQQGRSPSSSPRSSATPTATSARTSRPTRWPCSRTSPSRASSQGIGVYFSSGDSGDEVINLGTPSADFSASSPWVTAVGGTTLGVGQLGSTTLRDRVGDRQEHAQRHEVAAALAGCLHLRLGRRHQQAVHPALLPAGCRARRAVHPEPGARA